MAMKETYYFSHDYNARTDIKIKKLIHKHKMKGYGIYWAIVEDLYNNDNCLALDYEIISSELRENSKIIQSVIEDFDLFVIENNFFGSHSVQKRLEDKDKKSKQAKEAVRKRWNKANESTFPDTDVLRTSSDRNTLKEKKVKEVKEVKESKGNILADEPPEVFFEDVDKTTVHAIVKQAFIEKFYFLKKENYYWTGKDASHCDQLIQKISFKLKEKKMPLEAENFRNSTLKLIDISDEWLKTNLSMSNLNSKFNEIISGKNGKQQTNRHQETAIETLNLILNRGKEN